MTGYASATSGAQTATDSTVAADASAARSPAASLTSVMVELRSVNNRFLDLSLRLPDEFRSLEPVLRDLITKRFRRGKVELRLNTHRETESAWPTPQPDQLNRLSRIEGTVQSWLPKAQPLSVHEVLQWCKGSAPSEKLDEPALDAAKRCIAGLREAREREGARLVKVLMERVERLRELAVQAEPLVPAVVKRQQQRFLERWTEARRAAAARYDAAFAGSGIDAPQASAYARHVYHIYAIRTGERPEWQDALQEQGIQTGIHYPFPVHLLPAYADLGYRAGQFPHSERAANEVLSLPMFPELTVDQTNTVARAVLALGSRTDRGIGVESGVAL